MKRVFFVVGAIGFAGIVAGCSQPQRFGAPPTGPAPGGTVMTKRIVSDGAGGLQLPDGTRVQTDQSGGFTLPNGAYVRRDRSGALNLPNGSRCVPDNQGGYICP
ncbi:hypothetical protein [Bosea sp. (in: a-proteobacteria)]|jgi:hypothetical protein|uniref:hypothetical protein n=1 Tax=Bosea sp. (in: a-proteobacteria) TaxID=1871050 RepID=UPI001E1521D7|nr:hypothetical protein [Bosea sp. (in: a-proteobacteria)]MBA4223416.1 hypothetical protein [Methylobacterium sp.]MBR3193926.1 hypothetical protein [Bosea sp. (in: a-proteobacteria)]